MTSNSAIQDKATLPGGVLVVEELTMEHLPQVLQLIQEGFGTKRFLFCFRLTESVDQISKRYSKYTAEKFSLAAVAVKDDQVLGYVQMSTKGLPTYPPGLHSCKSGEMYIETIAVSTEARGQGVGTLLLEWCEKKARSRQDIDRLTLEVVNGNRAMKLYERFGFESAHDKDICDRGCDSLFTCCVLGRPFGCCNSEWGSTAMIKELR